MNQIYHQSSSIIFSVNSKWIWHVEAHLAQTFLVVHRSVLCGFFWVRWRKASRSKSPIFGAARPWRMVLRMWRNTASVSQRNRRFCGNWRTQMDGMFLHYHFDFNDFKAMRLNICGTNMATDVLKSNVIYRSIPQRGIRNFTTNSSHMISLAGSWSTAPEDISWWH